MEGEEEELALASGAGRMIDTGDCWATEEYIAVGAESPTKPCSNK